MNHTTGSKTKQNGISGFERFCRNTGGVIAQSMMRYGVTRNENSWKPGMNQTRPSMRFSASRLLGKSWYISTDEFYQVNLPGN